MRSAAERIRHAQYMKGQIVALACAIMQLGVFKAFSVVRFCVSDRLGGVPREQKLLMGHLSRVIHHPVN